MGAEQSTAAPAVADSNRSKRKRSSATDDADAAATEVPEVEISSDSKKRQRAARRKSTGRNDRKSLLCAPGDASGAGGAGGALISASELTAFHDDIGEGLPGPERLSRLAEEAFGHASRWISTRSAEEDRVQFQALAKKVFVEWHAKVSSGQGFETAVEQAAVRHNPRNTEMKHTLAMYHTTRDRLGAEQQAWEQAVRQRQPNTDRDGEADGDGDGDGDGGGGGGGKAKGNVCMAAGRQTVNGRRRDQSDKADKAMLAHEESRQQPEQALGTLDATIGLELTSMQAFTTQADKLLSAVARSLQHDQKTIAATRFVGYVAIDDPKKLISALGGPAPPTSSTGS